MCLPSLPPFGCFSQQKQHAARMLWATLPPSRTAPSCWPLLLSFPSLFGFQMKRSPRHPGVHNNSRVCSLPGTVSDFQGRNSLRTPLGVTVIRLVSFHGPHWSLAAKRFSFLFFPWCLILLQPLRENCHDFLANLWWLSALKVQRRATLVG